jgi:hypothetical protein
VLCILLLILALPGDLQASLSSLSSSPIGLNFFPETQHKPFYRRFRKCPLKKLFTALILTVASVGVFLKQVSYHLRSNPKFEIISSFLDDSVQYTVALSTVLVSTEDSWKSPEMEITEIILAKVLRLCQLSQSWVSF